MTRFYSGKNSTGILQNCKMELFNVSRVCLFRHSENEAVAFVAKLESAHVLCVVGLNEKKKSAHNKPRTEKTKLDGVNTQIHTKYMTWYKRERYKDEIITD